MIEQQARVTAIHGQDVTVEIGAQSGCPACDQGKGCGAGIFGRLLQRKTLTMQLPNAIGATPGQSVNVGIPEAEYLRLVWWLYGAPLLAALAGGVICHQIFSYLGLTAGWLDGLTLAGGIVAAGLVYRRVHRRLERILKPRSLGLLPIEDLELQCAIDGLKPDSPAVVEGQAFKNSEISEV